MFSSLTLLCRFLPCSHALFRMPLYGLCCQNMALKKYSHEMSKFYYFLNLSGNWRLLLRSHCPNRIDELMSAWPAGWAFRSSHSPRLGRFIKDEGKTRREEYPVGCSCSQWRSDLVFDFSSMSPMRVVF